MLRSHLSKKGDGEGLTKLLAVIAGVTLMCGVMLWRDKKSTDRLNQSRKEFWDNMRKSNESDG